MSTSGFHSGLSSVSRVYKWYCPSYGSPSLPTAVPWPPTLIKTPSAAQTDWQLFADALASSPASAKLRPCSNQHHPRPLAHHCRHLLSSTTQRSRQYRSSAILAVAWATTVLRFGRWPNALQKPTAPLAGLHKDSGKSAESSSKQR